MNASQYSGTRVVVTVEARFSRSPDGTIWTRGGPSYRFFTRYLSAFDRVRVVARVADVPGRDDGAKRVDGAGVEVWPVPCYIGPAQYLTRRAAVVRAVRAAAEDGDAVVLRVPSPLGSLLAASRERAGLPYAVEVVGDPYDVFAPGVIRHPLRPLLRKRETARLRHQCRTAVGAAYVTDRYLQARYPARTGAVTAAYSSIELPAEAYREGPRRPDPGRQGHTLVSVGTLEQMYKGVDTLVEALARLVATGLPLRLVHVGDGRCRPRVERIAERLGVADRVVLTGALPAGAEVRRRLDEADLFVMPSRTEGLPKALLEAMARGLPAVGTAVGGIPELLPPDDLVPPDDPEGLAGSIRQFLTDPARMAAASARNLGRAADFADEPLARRRDVFYHALRDATVDAGHRAERLYR
ncbi:glycosyltransferase [Plantactinospora alkalitolerans]|uniref:glycosyltransferase n=1 Tax=Plantactinospora alkalitolerans TaxID=2789879 RepID=UPI002B202E9C|nr:glycosyltransferase [Plantactinospora alkalitolerans]